MVVGELEVAALPRIQGRSAVVQNLRAVDPRIEPAVAPGRPLDVVDEVIPAVPDDRADGEAPSGRAGRAVRDHGPGGNREAQSGRLARHLDLEIRLPLRAGVMKGKHHTPGPRVGELDRKSTR